MKVNVLGTNYEIKESNRHEDEYLVRVSGYCDFTNKTCVIDDLKESEDEPGTVKEPGFLKKRLIRHELIHAFLHESGLDNETWARNEEIVDWLAIQFPKMKEVFEKANAL